MIVLDLDELRSSCRPTDLEDIVRTAAIAVGHTPSVLFAMADLSNLVVRVPTVLASLAVANPARRPQQHFIIGVQSPEELEVGLAL